jgi:putative oxidoreductase
MPVPSTWSPALLSVFRGIFGLMFLAHGVSKYFGIPRFPMPLTPMLHVAGALELVGGALLMIGLFTRPVAFVLSGMMAVAYFMAHLPQGFLPLANGGEAAILYCFAFLYLAAAGGGSVGVDAARKAA